MVEHQNGGRNKEEVERFRGTCVNDLCGTGQFEETDGNDKEVVHPGNLTVRNVTYHINHMYGSFINILLTYLFSCYKL